MASEIKRKQLVESLTHSLSSYFLRHADILGNLQIEGLFLSDDMREVKILIKFQGEASRVERILNSKKKDITEFSSSMFSTKYFPRIRFILVPEDPK